MNKCFLLFLHRSFHPKDLVFQHLFLDRSGRIGTMWSVSISSMFQKAPVTQADREGDVALGLANDLDTAA